MKVRFLTLIMFIAVSTFSQTSKTINIKGFGELNTIQNGDIYNINVGDYGTFEFQGTIEPINLKSEVTVEQLNKMPGYIVLKNLGLIDINLTLSDVGLHIEANVDTKGNLSGICNVLEIEDPVIQIVAEVSNEGIKLEGALDFSKDPIEVTLIEKSETKLFLERFNIGAELEVSMDIGDVGASPSIYISLDMKMKPSKWDPPLQTVLEIKYDLLDQTIIASGSMTDTWSNPFTLSEYFREDAIVLSNTAMSIGMNVLTVTPSNLGFSMEKAKIFELEFGIKISISPLDGGIAFEAYSNKISMADFSNILKNEFKLDVPDEFFRNDIYIDSTYLLFSPTGGTIGEFDIPQGFACKGGINLSDQMNASLDFSTNWDNGFYLCFKMNTNFDKELIKQIKSNNELALIAGSLIENIQINRLEILLKAGTDLKLEGSTYCDMIIMDKHIQLEMAATLDVEEMVDNLIKELIKEYSGEIAQATKFIKVAAGESIKIVEKAASEADKLIKDASIVAKHTHAKEICDTKCVPDLAKNLSRPINDGAFDAVRKFYFDVFPTLGKIKGETPEETRKLRSEIIKDDWDKLCNKIDKDWDKVQNDRSTYVRFYIKPQSAANGGVIYRKEVGKYRKKELEYRDKVWERMMKNTSTGNEKANLKGTEIPKGKYYIQSAMEYKKSNKGYLEFAYNKDKKTWKIKGQRMQVWTKDDSGSKKFSFERNNYLSYYIITSGEKNDKKFAIDCKGGKRSKKTPLHLWTKHKAASQQFYLKHVGGGKFAIMNKGGMAICLVDNKNANNGNKVHLWTYSNASSKQWYLINIKTGEAFIPK
jgi:hypothetical protein